MASCCIGCVYREYILKESVEYILELINALPLLGALLGVIMVKYLFGRDFEEKVE